MRKMSVYVSRSLFMLVIVLTIGCLGSSSDSNNSSNNNGGADDASDAADSFGASGAGLSLFPNDFRSGATGSPNLPKP